VAAGDGDGANEPEAAGLEDGDAETIAAGWEGDAEEKGEGI
jgi:hypothetical protein